MKMILLSWSWYHIKKIFTHPATTSNFIGFPNEALFLEVPYNGPIGSMKLGIVECNSTITDEISESPIAEVWNY